MMKNLTKDGEITLKYSVHDDEKKPATKTKKETIQESNDL